MGRHGVSRHGTTTSLCDQCRTASCLASTARDGRAAALSLRRCEASRLSGAEMAGRPALAAWECATIQQALQTRALADQCWELHARIDDWGRDADIPQRTAEGRPSGLVAGASAHFYGMAAARGARIGGRSSAWRTSGHQGSPGGRATRRWCRGLLGICVISTFHRITW